VILAHDRRRARRSLGEPESTQDRDLVAQMDRRMHRSTRMDTIHGLGSTINRSYSSASASASSLPVAPGQIVARRYRVEGPIARGTGVAASAIDLDLDGRVVVEFVGPESFERSTEARTRFLREARTAARLRSDHVAHLLDVGALHDGTIYVVLDCVEGTDLGAAVRAGGPLPIGVAVLYTLMASHALAEAHALGLVHRDIKPENLLLTRDPEGRPTIKVTDFGMSGLLDTRDGPRRVTASSLATMSPEQLVSPDQVDARADVWALGATLFHLITGHDAFEAASPTLVYARILGEPAMAPTRFRKVPIALEQVILRCLHHDPSERYADLAELAYALAPFAPEGGRNYAARIASILGRDVGDALAGRWMQPESAPPIGWSEPVDDHALTPREIPGRRSLSAAAVVIAMFLVGAIGGVAIAQDRATGGSLSQALGLVPRGGGAEAPAPAARVVPPAVAAAPIEAPSAAPAPSSPAIVDSTPAASSAPSTAPNASATPAPEVDAQLAERPTRREEAAPRALSPRRAPVGHATAPPRDAAGDASPYDSFPSVSPPKAPAAEETRPEAPPADAPPPPASTIYEPGDI
jgi:serine/threonine-protein kinase